MARFEYRGRTTLGRKSAKFWQIEQVGPRVHIRFGKIGDEGTHQVKTFASPYLAETYTAAACEEKRGKGYVRADAEPKACEKCKDLRQSLTNRDVCIKSLEDANNRLRTLNHELETKLAGRAKWLAGEFGTHANIREQAKGMAEVMSVFRARVDQQIAEMEGLVATARSTFTRYREEASAMADMYQALLDQTMRGRDK